MPKKIILSGYFGFDNLGDEAILYSMVRKFSEFEDVEIVALSKNPEKTTKKFNIRAVDRMSLGAVLKEIRTCDLFVSGGGSLLQDITSKRSVYYYLALIYFAKKIFKKKVAIYSQGVGPLSDHKNRKNVANLFNKVDLINVRDADSKNLLREIGVNKEIFTSADTVFTIENVDESFGKQRLAHLQKAKNIGISVRKWKDCDNNTVEEIAKFVKQNENKDINFVLLPFHHPDDLEISKEILKKSNAKNLFVIEEQYDEKEMLSIIKNMDIMISMRLHGAIFATICNSYPILLSYDPKLDSLAKEMQISEVIDIDNLKCDELQKLFDDVIVNIDNRNLKVSDIKQEMYIKAMKGVELVKELL